jgi:hypothetical protein
MALERHQRLAQVTRIRLRIAGAEQRRQGNP